MILSRWLNATWHGKPKKTNKVTSKHENGIVPNQLAFIAFLSLFDFLMLSHLFHFYISVSKKGRIFYDAHVVLWILIEDFLESTNKMRKIKWTILLRVPYYLHKHLKVSMV